MTPLATSLRSVVVIGAGQAGLQSSESLRTAGFAGSITLVGEEPCGPYHRPPLSKAWLAGELEAAQLAMRSPEVLARKDIALRTGSHAQCIDRVTRTVLLADGGSLAYDGLVLATGSRPRLLSVPGSAARNVLALRSRDDATALSEHLGRCAASNLPVVVVGGGFIGLEVAATARKKGLAVTVLEAAPRLLARVLTPQLSEWFAALHAGHGVELVFDARLETIETRDDLAVAVHCADGRSYPCGVVVVGIGVEANDLLARAAGLECDRGIVVDECARTSDPAIVAAGDCTARRLADGTLLRLESVNNASEQGKSAAAALLGIPRPFTGTPWFWSDQHGVKLQMAGLSTGSDRWVARGPLTDRAFSIFHFQGLRLIGVDSINASKDHLLARKLLDAGVSPTPTQAADTAFDLATLLRT